jgi:hypothetical protein
LEEEMKKTFTVTLEANDGRTSTTLMRVLRAALDNEREGGGIISGFSVSMPHNDRFNILEFNSNQENQVPDDEEIIFVRRRRANQDGVRKYIGFILKAGALGFTFFSADDKPKAARKPLPLTAQTLSEIVRFLEVKNAR